MLNILAEFSHTDSKKHKGNKGLPWRLHITQMTGRHWCQHLTATRSLLEYRGCPCSAANWLSRLTLNTTTRPTCLLMEVNLHFNVIYNLCWCVE